MKLFKKEKIKKESPNRFVKKKDKSTQTPDVYIFTSIGEILDNILNN